MDVELLAVTHINRLISVCPRLKASISTNDKTPFTDGHVEVYSGLGQSKSDWMGRVAVQVKGRTSQARAGISPTHSISRVDLIAYQKNSGVFYFFVIVDKEDGVCTAYYRILSPFAIDAILREDKKGRARVSVRMKRLSQDPEELERLLHVALKTQSQNVSLGFDAALLPQMASLTLTTASDIDFTGPVSLSHRDIDLHMVLNTMDGMSIPLSGELQIVPADYMDRPLDVPTCSGGYEFESVRLRRVSPSTIQVTISDGLRISFESEEDCSIARVELTLERTLPDRLKALGFYLGLIDTKVLEIAGTEVALGVAEDRSAATLRAHFRHLQWLSELLCELGVDTSLIVPDDIDEDQLRQLKVLHRAFVKKEELADGSAAPSWVLQQIGEWRLMFLVAPGGGVIASKQRPGEGAWSGEVAGGWDSAEVDRGGSGGDRARAEGWVDVEAYRGRDRSGRVGHLA